MERRVITLLLCLVVVSGCSSGGDGTANTPSVPSTGMVWDSSSWDEKNWK